jgi:hypothetical protein
MRVWILEYLPEYEPSDRIGVYDAPHRAGDDFLTQVGRLRERSNLLGTIAIEEPTPERDIRLVVRSGGLSTSDDWVTLTGVHLKGTRNLALSARDRGVLETLRDKIQA